MEQPLAVNAENSRAKVQNVGGDSSVNSQRLFQQRFELRAILFLHRNSFRCSLARLKRLHPVLRPATRTK
jgi:hypothetical protein